MTNAAPLDVFSTTEAAVVDSATTDGTIAPSIYEVDKYRAIVRLIDKWNEAEAKDKQQ